MNDNRYLEQRRGSLDCLTGFGGTAGRTALDFVLPMARFSALLGPSQAFLYLLVSP